MRAFLCMLSAALLFCGCSTTSVHDRPLPLRVGGVQLDSTAMVEGLLAEKGVFVQAVDASWRDRTFQAQCVRKCDGEKLTVVFLAPQMRLVTITVEKPHVVTCERVAQIPSSFEPEYALADLAYVNLDTAVLRRAVEPALKVEDDGRIRRILTPAGAPVVEVERLPDGDCALRNLEHGYTYTMQTLE